VMQQLRQKLVGLANTLFRPSLSQPQPHRQGIDEQAKHALRTRPALHPAKQYRPKHRVLPAGAATHHQAPGNMANARRTHPKTARLRSQPPGQIRIKSQTEFLYPRTVPTHIQQTKRRRRLSHIPQHPLEKRFMLLPANPQSGLRHKVTERKGSWQLRTAPHKMGPDLSLQNLQRRMVSDQVMKQLHHHPTPIHRVLGYEQPQQRRLAHIQPIMTRIKTLLQLPGYIPLPRIQPDLFHQNRRLTPFASGASALG